LTDFRFYRFVRRAFLIVARPMFRFDVLGAERIPETGPVIIVAPHRSWLDPPCVGAACPRPVRFLMVADLYHKPWARWFYARMKSLPVDPHARNSVVSLRRALAHLRDGGVVGVFPEGRVVAAGETEELKFGAAMLAVRAGATVVPMAIEGSAEAWPHRTPFPRPAEVRVMVGEPMPPEPTVDGVRRAAERLTERIAAVL
jgi:1-acyl-sn-glycerol-3-phosphate acyltransferase